MEEVEALEEVEESVKALVKALVGEVARDLEGLKETNGKEGLIEVAGEVEGLTEVERLREAEGDVKGLTLLVVTRLAEGMALGTRTWCNGTVLGWENEVVGKVEPLPTAAELLLTTAAGVVGRLPLAWNTKAGLCRATGESPGMGMEEGRVREAGREIDEEGLEVTRREGAELVSVENGGSVGGEELRIKGLAEQENISSSP